MKQAGQRPVFLNLLKIRLPIGGVLSIMHRVSGVLLVIAIPLFIYFLQLLGASENVFLETQNLLRTVPTKILVSLVLWVLIQHSISGTRHLLMDLDYGYKKQLARRTAHFAFALSFFLMILTGLLIWL